ncbi:NUMOD4 domain-containing protein [Bacillus sinesaloumensis]|uniref:NUMOD4 domain-containing protein n=1 Tax=Litchfieldia sinesaloumensis TaxID=1926280 RepID=UPI000988571A|nr:NUMOD4 domain-containing protein [Bacillus sinesaloumensis]
MIKFLGLESGDSVQEERKPIIGYENLYEITRSGKIFSVKRKRTMKRRGDEYGFHVVKLSKEGKATNHNVFELWQKHFPDISESEYRGAKKVIY